MQKGVISVTKTISYFQNEVADLVRITTRIGIDLEELKSSSIETFLVFYWKFYVSQTTDYFPHI